MVSGLIFKSSIFLFVCVFKFRADFCALNTFSVNFCVWYKLGVQLHSSACVCPVFLTPFTEKTYLVSIVCSYHKMIDQMSLFLGSLFCSIEVSFYATALLF